jgi:hypothetical protein
MHFAFLPSSDIHGAAVTHNGTTTIVRISGESTIPALKYFGAGTGQLSSKIVEVRSLCERKSFVKRI